MPHCQAPNYDTIFSENGKCGKKIMPNSDLHLCEYHYNYLSNAPPHPNKSFNPSTICLICSCKNKYSVFVHGICLNCMPTIEANSLSLLSFLECFRKNPSLLKSCDKRITELMKDFLCDYDSTLQRHISIEINKNNLLIKSVYNRKIISDYYIDSHYNLIPNLNISYL